MDNPYIPISLNYFEIFIIAFVLLYSFLADEKKSFTKMIVYVINKSMLCLRVIIKNKKYSQDIKSSNVEEK